MPLIQNKDGSIAEYDLGNGVVITDTIQAKRMYEISSRKPEKPVTETVGYAWNEIGLSDLFGEIYENVCRYCPEWKSWYYYDGTRWLKDEGAIFVSQMIIEMQRLLNMYLYEISDTETRDAYAKFVAKFADRRFRDRVLKDAQGTMTISALEFDANPYLINCLNGTYDLEHHTFSPHSYKDYLTMITNFTYTNRLKTPPHCKRWEQFIDEVCSGDKDKASYLQRALGYSLLGTSNEECFFILHGKTTRNGKSTLLNTIENMLGDYSKVSPVGLICKGLKTGAEGASPELASLKGKRFVTMSESNAYGRLDEERIKQMTGGENITARGLYQSPVSFPIQFTMWLSCNDLPAVKDRSLFSSERIHVIEFDHHFTQEEQDKNLKHFFLKTENKRGIFTWLLDGYKAYIKDGLKSTDKLQKVMTKYEKDNDLVYQFMSECTEKAESTVHVKLGELYKSFQSWCRQNGIKHVMIAKSFHNEVARVNSDWEFFIGVTVVRGYKVYRGLKIRDML